MLTAWLIYALWISALVSGSGVALARACYRAGAPQRWIWLAAMAGSFAIPLIGAVPRSAPSPRPAASTLAVVAGDLSRTVLPEPSPAWIGLDAAILVAWATASTTVLLLLAVAYARLRRAIRGGEVAVIEGETVRLTDDFGPAVVGFIRLQIVLPRWAVELPPHERQLIVRHERAHRDARDQWLLGLGLAGVASLPWNPFIWWQLRRLRQALEIDCDRRLVRSGAPPAAYGALLLDLAARSGSARMPVTALATPSSFLSRRLAQLSVHPPRARIARAALAGAAGVVLLAMACETTIPTDQPTSAVAASGPPGSARPPVRISGPAMRYPTPLRNAGIEGYVLVEFAVETTGNVDQASVRVLESSNRAFEPPVMEFVRGSRFRPATVDGKPLRLTIRQQLRFQLGSANTVPVVAPYLVALVPEHLFPAALAEAGIERAEVIVELTVAANGSPDLRTMRVVTSTHPAFERSAMEAMSRRPAYSLADRDGQAGPITLRQPFRYVLDRRLGPDRGVLNGAFKEIRARPSSVPSSRQ